MPENTTQIVYRKGDVHVFSVIRKIKLESGEAYWVLEDAAGKRFLLETKLYAVYGLKEGMTLTCRIDKINCSGRIFLEPLSELQEGQVGSFKVCGLVSRQDPIGKLRHFAEVATPLGNSLCEVYSPDKQTDTLFCRIRRIQKGHAWLELADKPVLACRQGATEEMLVLSAYHYHKGEHCYLVQDSYGNGHVINFEEYRHFGLRTGVWSDFIVYKVLRDESCLLEPVHPLYREGDTAVFTVTEISRQNAFRHQEGVVLLLEDDKGFKGLAFVSVALKSKYNAGSRINGVVQKFKKGLVVIEPQG